MVVHDMSFFSRSKTRSSELSPRVPFALETEPALRGPVLNGGDHREVGTCQPSTLGRPVLHKLAIGVDRS